MTAKEKEMILLYRSTMVISQLTLVQDELDEMEKLGGSPKHELKKYSNLFKKALEKEMKALYKNAPISSELSYYDIVNKLSDAISKKANEILLDTFKAKAQGTLFEQK